MYSYVEDFVHYQLEKSSVPEFLKHKANFLASQVIGDIVDTLVTLCLQGSVENDVLLLRPEDEDSSQCLAYQVEFINMVAEGFTTYNYVTARVTIKKDCSIKGSGGSVSQICDYC